MNTFLFMFKAIESAKQVAALWHSPDEALRSAAKETVLSFGNCYLIISLKLSVS